MIVFKRFWRSLTEKDSVKSARCECDLYIFSTFTLVLGLFFTRIRIRIFGRSGSETLLETPFFEKKLQFNMFKDPKLLHFFVLKTEGRPVAVHCTVPA